MAVRDRAPLGRLAGELAAVKAIPHAFTVGACRYRAERVVARSASRAAARTRTILHPGALLTGDSAHADLHHLTEHECADGSSCARLVD